MRKSPEVTKTIASENEIPRIHKTDNDDDHHQASLLASQSIINGINDANPNSSFQADDKRLKETGNAIKIL